MTNPPKPVSIANRFGHTARESEDSPQSRQRDMMIALTVSRLRAPLANKPCRVLNPLLYLRPPP